MYTTRHRITVPILGNRRVINVQGTNRKVHAAKRWELPLFSGQEYKGWRLYVFAGRKRTTTSGQLEDLFKKKADSPTFPYHVTKIDLRHENVPQTL